MSHQLKTALTNFKSCADLAPEGAYEEAKRLNLVIGEACNQLIQSIRALGLKADNCDLIFEVEAAIYDYVKRSNPESTLFPVSEGFGEAMDGPARSRVIEQAKNDVAFLRGAGVIN